MMALQALRVALARPAVAAWVAASPRVAPRVGAASLEWRVAGEQAVWLGRRVRAALPVEAREQEAPQEQREAQEQVV